MAARALDVARIQRVVNTCWLSRSLGQIPASAEQKGERGRDRGRERERAPRGRQAARLSAVTGPAFLQLVIRALHPPQENF